MNRILHDRRRWSDRGQIIVLLALCLTVMLMLFGLSIDVGFAYVTRAKLSRAVDAACLEAMKNLSQGQAMARTLAQNSFNANYHASGLDANVPALTINFTTDAFGQTMVTVNATATIRTFFMRIVPKYRTLTVSNSAEATRGKLGDDFGARPLGFDEKQWWLHGAPARGHHFRHLFRQCE